ncbi:MAG: class I SAM-dependent methyltransferase, partial [Micromonosporaceae bacterium]
MRLADVFELIVGGDAPVRFQGFDGSVAGPADAPVTVEIRSPRALSYLATSPGDVGLARAYIMGDLEVDGDLYTAMTSLRRRDLDLSWPVRLRAFRAMGGLKLLLRPPPRPGLEARLRGRRHSRARDAAAIAHHYDVSNRFYEWLLGPSMTYTCALYQTDSATLEQAQHAKHELVSRKLGLKPGDTVEVQTTMGIGPSRIDYLRIVGTNKPMTSSGSYVSWQTANRLLGESQAVSAVMLKLDAPEMKDVESRLHDMNGVSSVMSPMRE